MEQHVGHGVVGSGRPASRGSSVGGVTAGWTGGEVETTYVPAARAVGFGVPARSDSKPDAGPGVRRVGEAESLVP